jgi:flagellar motor switch protein FliG
MNRVIIGFLLLLCTSFLHANYLEKAAVEDTIQSKAQHILDTMYGPNLFSVTATVDIGRESWLISYTDRASITFDPEKNTPIEKYQLLPGYSALKNLAPNEAVQLPFNSKITKLPAPVIKITLDIVASKTIFKGDAKRADKLLTKLLDLNSERGDKINFVFESFPMIQNTAEVNVGLPVEAKLMIAVLIITSLFIIVYILLKIKQLDINKAAVNAQMATAKATAVSGNNTDRMSRQVGESSVETSVVSTNADSRFFGFVSEHNMATFLSIIKKRRLSVDQWVMLVSYLPPHMGKSVIEWMDDAQQMAIIQALSIEKIADKNQLVALETALKNELECAIGGVNMVTPIVAAFSDQGKRLFLDGLKTTPDIYNQVRPRIFLYDDIARLDDRDVKKIIQALKIEVLATAIANSETGASATLKSNLSAAAGAMVTQFIDLKKDTIKAADIHHAQSVVVDQMTQLNHAGTIDVVSKIMD